MGKQAKPRVLADSEAKSVLRNLRISPQKLNLVAAMIRGMDANKALATLTFSRRRIAGDVKKALQSAIANAETLQNLAFSGLSFRYPPGLKHPRGEKEPRPDLTQEPRHLKNEN